MSIMSSIENEYNMIVGDVKSIPEKLSALVGLHSKAQELASLEPAIIAIIEDPAKSSADKVGEILKAVGKL